MSIINLCWQLSDMPVIIIFRSLNIVSRSDAQSRHNFLGGSVSLYKVILPSPPFQYQGIWPKGTKMS